VGYKNNGPEYAVQCKPYWESLQSKKRGPNLLIKIVAAGVKNAKHTNFVGQSKDVTLGGLMASKNEVVATWSGSFERDRMAGNQKQLTKGCIAYLALETWLRGVPKSAAKKWYEEVKENTYEYWDDDSLYDYDPTTGIPKS
jgi:hypothetical protein